MHNSMKVWTTTKAITNTNGRTVNLFVLYLSVHFCTVVFF